MLSNLPASLGLWCAATSTTTRPAHSTTAPGAGGASGAFMWIGEALEKPPAMNFFPKSKKLLTFFPLPCTMVLGQKSPHPRVDNQAMTSIDN